MQVEDIQPGLLDKTPMSNIYVDNTFSDKYLDVANFSNTSHIKLPTLQSLIGTTDSRLESKPDFYSDVFQKSINNLKQKDETFLNPIYEIGTLNPNDVLPYVQQSTNYDNNISAAFGQAGKGIVIGATLGATTGGAATLPIGGVGAIPGSVIGGLSGGVAGFLSGLLGESGKQGFNIGFNNRQITAEKQSGFGNRLSGFTNHILDRSFEAGLGGTAALLATPFGAMTGKDMYNWGDNPLTARLAKGLEESEYTAKLSDNYLSKGPIAKLFTGEGVQNEMADMIGFTVGMMVGAKGLNLLNKGAGLLASPLVEGLGFEQKSLAMANGEGMLGQVLPTIAKQSSSYFTRGAKLASEGIAYDEQLMFQGWGKGIQNTYNAFKAEGTAGALNNVGKGITQIPVKFTNFFKDGTQTLNALSAFERTALASYGESRVEASSSYKDIYNTALRQGFTANEAANMATDGANRTLGMNMLLLGITNQFGLNNLLKARNVLPSLAKWLTKDFVFDNSTKLALKNVLSSTLKNAGQGFITEGFAEELGQFTIGEYNKKVALDTNNQVYKSFLQEFINTYKESINSDEGISNWFGGGLFGAITGMFGLSGGIIGSLKERNQAKNFNIPLSLQTKMSDTNEAIMNIMDHTSAFNGQLYTAYNRDENGNLVPSNQGTERFIKDPFTIIQLAKALDSITTLTRDQVNSIVDATSLEELLKNSTEKERSSLEDGFRGINSYLEHIDSIKEDKTGINEGFIEFVDKLTTQQRNNVMTTLHALETTPLSEKSKSVQDIMKQQLLSNYVYDHVSNGVEDKLFDELDLLEKTLTNPNANTQDLEFLGKKYKQGEQGQVIEDLKKQRKDIQEQVNVYRNLQLRFGSPLSYEYLRDSEGNIQKHAITVPLKKVFRSAIRQKELQKSIKENLSSLDKLQISAIEKNGGDAILEELNKGLKGDISNIKLTEKLMDSDKIDELSKNRLKQHYDNNTFLENNLNKENKYFNNLIDAKKIIAKLHKDFKNLQSIIDEVRLQKEKDDAIKAQQQAELDKKAQEQAAFEEQQRLDLESGKKTEEQLAQEKLDRDNQNRKIEALKQKQILIKSFNDKITDLSFKVVNIKDGNTLTVIFQNGVTIDMTVDQFNERLKSVENEWLDNIINKTIEYYSNWVRSQYKREPKQANIDLFNNIKNSPSIQGYESIFQQFYNNIRTANYDNSNIELDIDAYTRSINSLIKEVREENGWHYRIPFGSSLKNSKYRISLNIQGNTQVIDILDKITNDYGIYYKTPDLSQNWLERNDPVTIYITNTSLTEDQLKELKDRIVKETKPFIRSNQGFGLYGENLSKGVEFGEEATEKIAKDLIERASKIDSVLSDAVKNYLTKRGSAIPKGSVGQQMAIIDLLNIAESNIVDDESFMSTVLDRESDNSFLPELTEKNFKSTIGLDFRDGKYEAKGTPHEKAMTNFYELVQDQFLEEGETDEKYYLQPISGKNIDKSKPIYAIWTSGGFIPKDNEVILILMDKITNKPIEHKGSFAYVSLPIYSEFYNKDNSIKSDNDIIEALLEKTESGYRRYRFPFINAVLEGQVENLTEEDREFAIRNTLLTEYVPIVKAGLKEKEDFIRILNDNNVDSKSLKLPIVGYREGILTRIERTNLNELKGIIQDNLKIQPATKNGRAKILYNDKLITADRNFIKSEDLDFIVSQLLKYGQLEEKTKESTKEIKEELEKLIYIKTLKSNENFLELNKNAISLSGNMLYRGGQTFGIDLTKSTELDIKNYLSFNNTFNLPYHVKNTLFTEEDLNIGGKKYKSYEQFLKEKVFSVNYDISNDVIISKQANFIYPNTVTPKTNSQPIINNTVKVSLESIVDNLLNLPNLSMRGKFTQENSEVLFKILNNAKSVTDLQLLERALLINYLIGLNIITDQVGPDRIPIVNDYLKSLQEIKIEEKPALTQSEIEAKKADIEKRRQEELDKTNAQLETIEKNGESFIRAKVEIYTTLSNEETLAVIEIVTFKDGSRRIRTRDSKTEELLLEEKIKKENTTTNEQFIESWVGNLDNSLKKISEDNNPNKTAIDKINAKYNTELAALEGTTTDSDKKADIERRRKEELDRETPVKNENIIVNDGTDNLTFKIITFKDGSTLVRHIKTNETTADNKSKKLITYPTLEDFQNLLKYDFDENAKIVKTELVKDDYTDKQSQEIKAAKEKTINAKYDAELKVLVNEPIVQTETTQEVTDKDKNDLFARKRKDKKSFRKTTKVERDSYIRENIEDFKTWIQKVLPQFPVETSKDIIDGIAEGMFYKNVITLYENAETGTGFHEAFEAVWNSLLTKEQRDDLRNEFKSRQGTFKYSFSNEILSYSEVTDAQAKETMAEEFRTFMLNKELSPKQPIKNNFFLRLWNYIKDLFNTISPFQKQEISKLDTLFNEINQGNLSLLKPTALYGEKEYRLIKEDEQFVISNYVLSATKSKLFEVFSDITNTQDVLLLDKKNNDILNTKLEEIRQFFENQVQTDPVLKQIQKDYFSEEGFKNYTLPHLKQHISTFGIETELEETDEDTRDKENFIESMYIDSKTLVGSAIKTLVHTLSNKEYNGNSYENVYGDYDFFGEYNTFVDGHKVINILQNTLSNTPSRVHIDGKVYNAIDLMFEKLDAFQFNGVYKKGYEWIPELKERVNKNHSLKMAFEKSFCTTRVQNTKVFLKEGEGLENIIVELDPVQDETITNIRYKYIDGFREKYNVDNELEKTVALPVIKEGSLQQEFNQLLDFLGIDKNEFVKAKQNNESLYNTYLSNILIGYDKFKTVNKEKFIQVSRIEDFLTSYEGIGSSFKNLMILNTNQDEKQLVYKNADGKKQYGIFNNTTWSQLINVVNLVKTKQDLLNTLPHLANNTRTDFKNSFKHSVVLNNLFDKNGKRTSYKLNYTLINGVDIDKDSGMVTADLNDIDRAIQRVFYLRKGLHYTMVNSDKSSEFAINLGPLLGNHADKDYTQFTEYLWETYAKPQLEVYNSYLGDQKSKYEYFTKSLNNGDLGFFGKVKLNKDNLIDIETSKSYISKYLLKNISEMITSFSTLSDEINLLSYFYEGEVTATTKQRFEKEVVYNTLISTLEQHMFIYGDPMFYKVKNGILDSPKRTSVYNASKEQILQSQEHWNEQYKQTVRLIPKDNDGKFGVSTFDDIEVMFQKDKLNHLLLDAYESIKQTFPSDITNETISKMLGVDFTFNNGVFTVTNYRSEGLVKAYLEMNEADAQAYVLTDFYMDIMYRSAKLKPEQIDTLNWKKAKEIEIRSSLNNKNPLYKKFTKEQVKWAKDKIKELGKDPKAVLTTLKPQYSGYSVNDNMLVPVLLKNSVFPLHFIDLYDENTKTIIFPKAMDVYIKAQNNNVDIVGHRSGQKFGATLDQKGEFTSLFKDGVITDEYPVVQTMYETFLGIQSEIPAKRKFEILNGSQITKIITQNLNESAKTDPELDQTLKDYTENINARKNLGLKELENKFGLIPDGDTYKIDNPFKIVDQIRKELNRLNLPDNVKDIIELNAEQDNVKYKFEASPNNISLQSVLLSMVDKSLVHQKVRGKGSVQIAGSLFSNETRTVEKVTIDGKEKEIATSSDLEFYYDKKGKLIGMEVFIPNPFYDIYPDLTWEQFKVMADKNPKLYQLCGYRIPTQSLGQFESITIKGFYNNSLGDSIIVPSGIVAKAGSDFDIDKLFLYLPHVRLTKNNQLEYIEYLDDSNSTVEERYKKYGLTKVYDEYSKTINDWFDSVKESNESLQKAYDNLQDIKKENSLTRDTFNTLPTTYKQAFWDRNAELDEFNIKGVAKIMDFRDLANRYIDLLKDKKDLKSLPIIDKLSTMISEYDRYLNIDKSIYEEFNKVKDAYIEERDFFMENKDFVLSSTMLDKGFISQEEFEQLSIPEQNSVKALENRNIELMIKLASYKTNAYTAMIPNNADTLKALVPKKGTDTYISIASFNRQNDFRQANLVSKSLVGMAAVHVTGHCITQNGQTKLTGTFTNRLGEKENINMILPVPYKEFLAFDHIWDTNGSLISANLSEFLSAIVDAAKDPFIFDLNINEETLNIALYLTRLGVSLKDTIYFLSTPIIKRYLKNKQIESGLFKKGVFKNYIKSQNLILVESIHENRLKDIRSLSGDNLIHPNMFYKIGMFGVITNPETGYPSIDYDVFESRLQYLYDTVAFMIKDTSFDFHEEKDPIVSVYVLLSYLKYSEQSGYLSNVNRAISIDTKSPNTISTTVDLQNQKEKIKQDDFIANSDDIFNNTFLGNLWNNKEKGLEQLSNYQIMANKTFIDSYLTPALNIINRDKFVSTETKTKLINKFQNFLITYHLQNYEFESGVINNRKTSIKESVIKNYNKVLNQNPEFLIFKLLTKNKVKDNELENIVKLRSTVQTTDINKSIEEMLEFIQLYENSDNIDEKQESDNVKEFLKSLTDYSVLQSGFGPSNISFANYLPLQTYTDYLNPAFVDLYENIESKVNEAPIAQLWKQFVQNNSTDKNLVDQILEDYTNEGEPYLTKGYKGSPGLLEKTYNLTDTVPLYVNVTYDDPQFGTKQMLNQIKSIKQIDLKLAVTYSMIPTLGRGKYFTETTATPLTLKDETLINIINSNKLENNVNFEPEMDITKDEILEDYSQNTQDNNIYSQLGSKTKSENVVIKPWNELKDATKAITNNGNIISTRIKNTNEHFGNPFSHDPAGKAQGLIKTETVKEAVENYITWIQYGHYAFMNDDGTQNKITDTLLKQDNRRDWILKQLKIGNLKDKQIAYYKELEEPSHATALDFLINQYDWSNQNVTNNQSTGLTLGIQQDNQDTTIEEIVQDQSIIYTPKGKATQTYIVRGSKIFNREGKEVFASDSVDRNKIFANLAVQQGRAVIVNYKDADYVVNNKKQIISVTTGKQMQWADNNGDRQSLLALSIDKFNTLNSTTKIPRTNNEGNKNECI